MCAGPNWPKTHVQQHALASTSFPLPLLQSEDRLPLSNRRTVCGARTPGLPRPNSACLAMTQLKPKLLALANSTVRVCNMALRRVARIAVGRHDARVPVQARISGYGEATTTLARALRSSCCMAHHGRPSRRCLGHSSSCSDLHFAVPHGFWAAKEPRPNAFR